MKNKKRNATVTFDYPSTHNMEELATLPDEDLALLLRELQESREKAKEVGAKTYPCEIEICYVRRELQIRKMHHQAHQRYEALEAEPVDESNLPSADLDNTAYVQAWLSWKGRTRDHQLGN